MWAHHLCGLRGGFSDLKLRGSCRTASQDVAIAVSFDHEEAGDGRPGRWDLTQRFSIEIANSHL